MKPQKKLIFALSFLTSLIAGCSDVAFSPGPPVNATESSNSNNQGLSGTIYETFYATAVKTGGAVDILFVVDNSTSMTLEQQKLGERLDTFVNSLDGLDWQIGITTTDVTSYTYGLKGSLISLEGASGYILNNNIPSYEQVFKDTVVRKETIYCDNDCPSSNEQPLAATILAIEKRDTDNAGFFRGNANLAVIMLSDEDEMSTGPAEATTPEQFITAIDTHFGISKRVNVFGIIIEPGDTDCYEAQDTLVSYGNHVSRLARLTGGLTGSICDNDYTKNLQNIGQRVKKELQNEVILTKDPAAGSLKITLIPEMNINWSLQGKKVIFEESLPEGTRIDVAYEEKE